MLCASGMVGYHHRLPSTVIVVPNFHAEEQALSCLKVRFPSVRHNEIRDFTANLLAKVCNNVCTESHFNTEV